MGASGATHPSARQAIGRRASLTAFLPAKFHPSNGAKTVAKGEFFGWYASNASGEGFTRATLQRYRSHLIERGLSAASINLAIAAPCKLASEAAANGRLSPLAIAGIRGVPGARRSGVRTGNWLTLQQAQQLLAEPNPETIKRLRLLLDAVDPGVDPCRPVLQADNPAAE